MLAFIGVVTYSATGAFFTDTETSSNSTFTAGTLELDINDNALTSPFTLGLTSVSLNPGEETDPMVIEIGNGGSMPLAWFGYFNTSGNDAMLDAVYIKSAKMEFLNPGETNAWEPTDQFITNGDGSGSYPTYYQTLAGADDKISLREWINGNNAMNVGNGVMMGAVDTGGYKYRFTFTLAMLPEATNAMQGKILNLSYTVTSTQINTDALNALFAADPKIVGVGADHVTWLNNQIEHQGTVNTGL